MCRHCGLEHSEHERCWDAMRHELASREESCAALKNENEALRDAIEALHECVNGTGRRSDTDVAELLNGAMRIPRANKTLTGGSEPSSEAGGSENYGRTL